MVRNPLMPSRIPAVPDSALRPADVVHSILQRRKGKLLNLDRMLLNSPAYAVGWNSFLGAVRTGLSLNARLRELAICSVAVLTQARYEYDQHAPEFLQAGGLQTQLNALQNFDAALTNHSLFDATDCAVMALAQAMTQKVQVPDACFKNMQQQLPNVQQQVELVGVIAAYNMVARFLEALQVQPESNL